MGSGRLACTAEHRRQENQIALVGEGRPLTAPCTKSSDSRLFLDLAEVLMLFFWILDLNVLIARVFTVAQGSVCLINSEGSTSQLGLS